MIWARPSKSQKMMAERIGFLSKLGANRISDDKVKLLNYNKTCIFVIV